jgi:hypothetical protein
VQSLVAPALPPIVLTGAPLSFPKIRSGSNRGIDFGRVNKAARSCSILKIMLNPKELDEVDDFRF